MLTQQEIARHDSKQSCWVIIRDAVYDVTAFLDSHPGGAKSILRWGGKDGTEEYDALHAAGTLEKALIPGTVTEIRIPQPIF